MTKIARGECKYIFVIGFNCHYNNSRPDKGKEFRNLQKRFTINKKRGRNYMKEFEYVIKEAVGIHARPASLLVKEASGFKSTVRIYRNENQADAKKLLSIMSLGVKCSETVRFVVEGEDEEAAACKLQEFCRKSL